MSTHCKTLTKSLALIGAAVLFGLYSATASAQVATDVVCTGCVDTGDIAVGAVKTGRIAAGAVSTSRIAVGAVTTSRIAVGAVRTGRIANGAVSASKLAFGAVTAARLADGAVTSVKIADGAVTFAKLDEDAVFLRIKVVSPVGLTATDNCDELRAVLARLQGLIDAGNPTAPSANNPYLIHVEPGVYDCGSSSLFMLPFVDMQGSGQGVTRVIGDSADEFNGVIVTTDNAELRFLEVENMGGGTFSVAVTVPPGKSGNLTHVTAIAGPATSFSCGMLVQQNGTVKIQNSVMDGVFDSVTVDGLGGQTGFIVASQMNGPVNNAFKCIAAYDENGEALGPNCQPLI